MSERTNGQITPDCDATLIDDDGFMIASVIGSNTSSRQDEGNIKRLALCWNACEHLTDEELSEAVVSVAKLRQACIGWEDATAKATAMLILDWMTRREGP